MIDPIAGIETGHVLRDGVAMLLHLGRVPLVVFAALLAVGTLVTTSWGRMDRVVGLPGISAGCGLPAGVAALGYGLAVFGVVISASGGAVVSNPPNGAGGGAIVAVGTPRPFGRESTRSAMVQTPVATAERAPMNGSRRGAVVVTVTEVVDGDTIDVRFENGRTDTVRLLGVDTPEVYEPNEPAEFEGVPDTEAGTRCLRNAGRDASNVTRTWLAGRRVELRFDARSDRRGAYGRLLAYVVVDGQNVNHRLVTEGYARLYESEFTMIEAFAAAEKAARSDGLGVWRCRAHNARVTTVRRPVTDSSSSQRADRPDEFGGRERRRRAHISGASSGSEPAAVAVADVRWTVNDRSLRTVTR